MITNVIFGIWQTYLCSTNFWSIKLYQSRKDLSWVVIELKDIFNMVEVVHTLHRVPSDSDVVEHQTVYHPVLHPPEELRLPQHAGGGNGDVLEGDPEHVSWVSSIFVRICPGLDSFTEL